MHFLKISIILGLKFLGKCYRTMGLLTMSGGIIWPGDKDNFLITLSHRFHVPIKRHPCAANQHQAVIRLNCLQGLRKFFLQTFRIRLKTKITKV